MTIGELGPWTLAAARKRVTELRRELDCGIDPLAGREAKRTEPSVSALWKWYEAGAFQKLGRDSQREIARVWAKEIETRLGAHTKIGAISRSEVQRLVDAVSAKSGNVAGNRCHSYLRRILNLAVDDGMLAVNPALKIRRNKEQERERYLRPDELKKLMGTIRERFPSHSAIAIALLLLTGARRSEVLSMCWSDLDLEKCTWHKPGAKTKQRRSHKVPLSFEAVEILKLLKTESGLVGWVFPSSSSSGHLVGLKREWKTLCAIAGIENARLHDLRHSFASLIASNGGSLEMIGALLGHSQPSTTKRYAHLYDDPLRQLTDGVAQAVK